MLGKVLIVDDMHPLFMESLCENFHLDFKPGLNYSDTSSLIPDYDVLVVRTGIVVDQNLINLATHLKVIARAGAGMDNIDVYAAELRGIVCVNAPEGNRDAVAEQTVGTLLALLHNIAKSDREVRRYSWNREANRGTELGEKTVAIIGYGNTGEQVARRLGAFNCRILAFDLFKQNFGTEYVKETDMNQIFEEADIVSLHVPLTDLTLRMLNLDFINRFKKTITLLNLSRGKIMVLRDLLNAMDNGKIIALGMDVLENEKIHGLSTEQQVDFERLVSRDDVIITPHVGGWTVESYRKISEILSIKIKDVFIERSQKENNFVKHVKTPR